MGGSVGRLCAVLLAGASALVVAGSGGSGTGAAGNGRFVFSCSGCPENPIGASLYTVFPDGSGLSRITPPCSVDRCRSPSQPVWSPAGRRLAYTTTDGIWIARADGSLPKLAFRNSGPQTGVESPSWSPDGRRLVFCRGSGIWTVDVDRRLPRRLLLLTGLTGAPVSLAWSPDGRRIAIGTNKERLYLVGVDGRGLRRLGADTKGRYPRWSPDSRRLVFIRWERERVSVAVATIGRNGTAVSTIARHPELDFNVNPVWSPDGRFVAFVTKHVWGDREYVSGQLVVTKLADRSLRNVEIPELPRGNVWSAWNGIDWQPVRR